MKSLTLIVHITKLSFRFPILGHVFCEISSARCGLNMKPVILASQFFQRLALRLGDKEGREDSEEPKDYKIDVGAST